MEVCQDSDGRYYKLVKGYSFCIGCVFYNEGSGTSREACGLEAAALKPPLDCVAHTPSGNYIFEEIDPLYGALLEVKKSKGEDDEDDTERNGIT